MSKQPESKDTIVMYGAPWCPDCRQSKQFLGDHRIQFDYINIDENPDASDKVIEINNGMRIIPTIVFPDGEVLTEPSNAELAEKLGLQTKAERTFYDVIIIGGGPTGLTAGIYTTREGLDTLLIERAGLGGQVGVTQMLDNYPGFDEGVGGEVLADRLVNQAKRFGVEILQAQEVSEVGVDGKYKVVRTADGSEYCARAVLIATGSHYRRLEIPGESKLIGFSVHFCATCDGAFYEGKEIMVIGGGNSGFEESLYLTRYAKKITIVEFMPEVNASRILQEEVEQRKDQIEVLTNHAIKEFKVGKGSRLEGVVLEDRATGELKEMHPAGIFVFIGLTPNASFLGDEFATDKWGFIETEDNLMTSVEGVFAAGDVRAGSTKQAAAAAGEGVTAALMIRQHLEKEGKEVPVH
jgi:thioredoxin reductase (NADPH)